MSQEENSDKGKSVSFSITPSEKAKEIVLSDDAFAISFTSG